MTDYLSRIDGLLPHQPEPVEHLLNVVRKHGRALDASDMGAGKTYAAIAVARELDLPTLVVCPKSAVVKWERVGDSLGCPVTAINYERLTRCKNPFGKAFMDRNVERWKWSPEIRFLIFDECHRCGGTTTLNHRLMIAARQQNLPALALSATAAENPTRMKALGYFLGLFGGGTRQEFVKTPRGIRIENVPSMAVSAPFRKWAEKYGCRDGWEGWGFYGDESDMKKIHKTIFPERGVRLRVDDIPGFPETQIDAELIDFDDNGRMGRLYKAMEPEIRALAERTKEWNPEDGMMQKLLERQQIDLLRVPILLELAHDAVAEGRSVALFVPYRATLQALSERLKDVKHSVIWGGQSSKDRQDNIDAFQGDQARIVIVVNQAGAETIDLHDVRGQYPRTAYIVPPYEAWLLRQIVGRVRRTGGKSKSIQRILCAKGTYEEKVFESLIRKSMNMDALNDGDLNPFNYEWNKAA